jgi:hypothetical protein
MALCRGLKKVERNVRLSSYPITACSTGLRRPGMAKLQCEACQAPCNMMEPQLTIDAVPWMFMHGPTSAILPVAECYCQIWQ